MKYIISENKLMDFFFKFLDEIFEGVEMEVNPDEPKELYFVKDGKVFMCYDTTMKDDGYLDISHIEVMEPFESLFSEFFTSTKQMKNVILTWAKEKYGINPLSAHSVMEFSYKPKR